MPIQTAQQQGATYTCPGPDFIQNIGSSVALTADYAEKYLAFNLAAGSVATLPAATGSGLTFNFITTVAVTSNHSGVATATTSDFLIGDIISNNSGTLAGWNSAAATNHAFQLNGTTTGGASVGEKFTVVDIAPNLWLVSGVMHASGTTATPFKTADA